MRYSLAQQLLIALLMPPVLTAVLGIMATGWTQFVWGGRQTDFGKKFVKITALVVLVLLYLMSIGMLVYRHLLS